MVLPPTKTEPVKEPQVAADPVVMDVDEQASYENPFKEHPEDSPPTPNQKEFQNSSLSEEPKHQSREPPAFAILPVTAEYLDSKTDSEVFYNTLEGQVIQQSTTTEDGIARKMLFTQL